MLFSLPLICSFIFATASIVSTMPLRACGCHTSYLLLSSSRPLFFWLCVGYRDVVESYMVLYVSLLDLRLLMLADEFRDLEI
jgi:hypothetical protein